MDDNHKSALHSPDSLPSRPGGNELSAEACIELLEARNLPENIVRHVKAVRDRALQLGNALNGSGMKLDLRLIENAALLHDICRTEKHHAEAGAELMASMGYTREADIIRQHHNPDSSEINEAAIVYLADKLVKEDKPVSLEERFSASLSKCKTAEAVSANRRRYAQACEIRDNILKILNK